MRSLLAIALFAGACSAWAQGVPQKPAAAAAPAAPAKAKADEPDAIRVLLAPELETTLVSQSVGRVRAVGVTLGSRFPKGKALVSFDCEEPTARLRMAEAELVSARESHDAKVKLHDLQQAGQVEVALAAAAEEKARAQVGLYRAQTSQCSIAAPFAGRAVKIAVKPFQAVTQGQPLLEIVSDGPLKLRLNAPAKWLAWLKVGTPFNVDIDETGKRYAAKVTALNGRIDAVSQTIELEATIDSSAKDLIPGMSGVARFAPPK